MDNDEDKVVGPGAQLLQLLQSAGCPGTQKMIGEDLDWVWELPGKEVSTFLGHIIKSVGSSSSSSSVTDTLTDQEIRDWQRLQETEPEHILSGDLLEEALRVFITKRNVRF